MLRGRRFKDECLRVSAVATTPALIRGIIRFLARRGHLPSAIWTRVPVSTTFDLEIAPGVQMCYTVISGDRVGRYLYWRGPSGWEEETTSIFALLARTASVVLDIGANTGLYSLIACASNSNSKVVAFEPVDRIAVIAERMISSNGWADRCQVIRAAVSDADGETEFHVPVDDIPHSASLNLSGFRNMPGEISRTRVLSIDSLPMDGASIDLVKIDVEGFEEAVLRGMAKVLDRDSPAVVLEILPEHRTPTGTATRLRDHGYELFHLTRHGPVATDGAEPSVSPNERNFVAVKRPEHRSAIATLTVPC